MVNLSTVRTSNAELRARAHGLVGVFVGATGGIGASTLRELTIRLSAPRFYVIGRSESRFSAQRDELLALNPSAIITFLQAEVSLLREVDAVCRTIAAKEDHVDLLFMSAGFLAFGGPDYTTEGLDKCAALSYYSRMRLTSNLLPLLRRSAAPRILSVLAGGQERAIRTDDLLLEHDYTIVNMVNHATTMHTLAFEHLARENPSISFIHAHPGWVHTGLVTNLFTPAHERVWYSPVFALLRWMATLFFVAFGISPQEAGERQAFHATNSRYAAPAPGDRAKEGECTTPHNAIRLSWQGEVVTNSSVLGPYRKEQQPKRIWNTTLQVFEKALSGKSCV